MYLLVQASPKVPCELFDSFSPSLPPTLSHTQVMTGQHTCTCRYMYVHVQCMFLSCSLPHSLPTLFLSLFLSPHIHTGDELQLVSTFVHVHVCHQLHVHVGMYNVSLSHLTHTHTGDEQQLVSMLNCQYTCMYM